MEPIEFIQSPLEFIGDAKVVVDRLGRKVESRGTAPRGYAWLFLGDPGIGKTSAALALAKRMTRDQAFLIEHVNGQSTTVDLVRGWRDSAPYRPLYGDSVKLVDEIDLASPAAQNELLTYLDRLPAWNHVIATTNRSPSAWPPRLAPTGSAKLTKNASVPSTKPSPRS